MFCPMRRIREVVADSGYLSVSTTASLILPLHLVHGQIALLIDSLVVTHGPPRLVRDFLMRTKLCGCHPLGKGCMLIPEGITITRGKKIIGLRGKVVGVVRAEGITNAVLTSKSHMHRLAL